MAAKHGFGCNWEQGGGGGGKDEKKEEERAGGGGKKQISSLNLSFQPFLKLHKAVGTFGDFSTSPAVFLLFFFFSPTQA